MSRISVSSLILLLLLPAAAFAAATHKRPPVKRWNYGFLPGYHQPLSNTIPIIGPRGASNGNGPAYVPHYYYYGDKYYFGRPGFDGGGRYNGGSYGPCWTITPIGRVWNCG